MQGEDYRTCEQAEQVQMRSREGILIPYLLLPYSTIGCKAGSLHHKSTNLHGP